MYAMLTARCAWAAMLDWQSKATRRWKSADCATERGGKCATSSSSASASENGSDPSLGRLLGTMADDSHATTVLHRDAACAWYTCCRSLRNSKKSV